jgi:hypothetical protein
MTFLRIAELRGRSIENSYTIYASFMVSLSTAYQSFDSPDLSQCCLMFFCSLRLSKDFIRPRHLFIEETAVVGAAAISASIIQYMQNNLAIDNSEKVCHFQQ